MLMQDITRLAARTALPALPVTTGLAAGTPVETRAGWRPVETLAEGDRVHTLDGGLAAVVGLRRTWALPGTGSDPVTLPGGAFGNCAEVTLMPDQTLLFDLAPDDVLPLGLPATLAVMMPAAALEGHRGATRPPMRRPVEVVVPVFAAEELVWAASGLLLACPAAGAAAPATAALPFPRLSPAAARRFLAGRETMALPGWAG
jgi:hypothetical protein